MMEREKFSYHFAKSRFLHPKIFIIKPKILAIFGLNKIKSTILTRILNLYNHIKVGEDISMIRRH